MSWIGLRLAFTLCLQYHTDVNAYACGHLYKYKHAFKAFVDIATKLQRNLKKASSSQEGSKAEDKNDDDPAMSTKPKKKARNEGPKD